MANIDITAATQFGLDGGEGAAEFQRGFRIQFFDAIGCLADNVIAHRLAEVDFVESGSVVEKRTSDEANFFKRGHAAIYGDEVAGSVAQACVQVLDAGRLRTFAEFGENRDAGLGDAETRRFESGGREVDGGCAMRRVFSASQRVIRLG